MAFRRFKHLGAMTPWNKMMVKKRAPKKKSGRCSWAMANEKPLKMMIYRCSYARWSPMKATRNVMHGTSANDVECL